MADSEPKTAPIAISPQKDSEFPARMELTNGPELAVSNQIGWLVSSGPAAFVSEEREEKKAYYLLDLFSQFPL